MPHGHSWWARLRQRYGLKVEVFITRIHPFHRFMLTLSIGALFFLLGVELFGPLGTALGVPGGEAFGGLLLYALCGLWLYAVVRRRRINLQREIRYWRARLAPDEAFFRRELAPARPSRTERRLSALGLSVAVSFSWLFVIGCILYYTAPLPLPPWARWPVLGSTVAVGVWIYWSKMREYDEQGYDE